MWQAEAHLPGQQEPPRHGPDDGDAPMVPAAGPAMSRCGSAAGAGVRKPDKKPDKMEVLKEKVKEKEKPDKVGFLKVEKPDKGGLGCNNSSCGVSAMKKPDKVTGFAALTSAECAARGERIENPHDIFAIDLGPDVGGGASSSGLGGGTAAGTSSASLHPSLTSRAGGRGREERRCGRDSLSRPEVGGVPPPGPASAMPPPATRSFSGISLVSRGGQIFLGDEDVDMLDATSGGGAGPFGGLMLDAVVADEDEEDDLDVDMEDAGTSGGKVCSAAPPRSSSVATISTYAPTSSARDSTRGSSAEFLVLSSGQQATTGAASSSSKGAKQQQDEAQPPSSTAAPRGRAKAKSIKPGSATSTAVVAPAPAQPSGNTKAKKKAATSSDHATKSKASASSSSTTTTSDKSVTEQATGAAARTTSKSAKPKANKAAASSTQQGSSGEKAKPAVPPPPKMTERERELRQMVADGLLLPTEFPYILPHVVKNKDDGLTANLTSYERERIDEELCNEYQLDEFRSEKIKDPMKSRCYINRYKFPLAKATVDLSFERVREVIPRGVRNLNPDYFETVAVSYVQIDEETRGLGLGRLVIQALRFRIRPSADHSGTLPAEHARLAYLYSRVAQSLDFVHRHTVFSRTGGRAVELVLAKEKEVLRRVVGGPL
eukprot:g221.t1